MSLQFPDHLQHERNWQQDVKGSILGLLAFAYNFLSNCWPRLDHFLTICYTSGIDSKMWGVPFWGCWSCIAFPDQLLTSSWPFPYDVLHERNWQQDVRGTILGLLVFAYRFLSNCWPRLYHFLTICYTSGVDSKMWGVPCWGCWCLHTMPLPTAGQQLPGEGSTLRLTGIILFVFYT